MPPAPDPVRLLLVRHGERHRDGEELAPLTADGRSQAEMLAACLQPGPLFVPEAILTSEWRHARDHAEILSGLFERAVPVVPSAALTPRAAEPGPTLTAIRRETATSVDWARARVVLCVGHEPELGRIARATGVTPEDLVMGEMVSVEGDSWDALEGGRGRLGHRIQPTPLFVDEAELVPKIQSKMQTSALLAGFSSATFGIVLTQSDYWTAWPPGAAWPSGAQGVAVAAGLVLLALATLLFVAAIYMYDRLALPRRYWDEPRRDGDPAPCPQDRWRSFRRNRVRHGILYAYMVWIWQFVFTVAVAMAMLGFLALVAHRDVWPVGLAFVAAVAAVVAGYLRFRPELGVD